ncbi:MAG: flagellar basal body P-ring formation chaperone FlgA [Lautropia sp.]
MATALGATTMTPVAVGAPATRPAQADATAGPAAMPALQTLERWLARSVTLPDGKALRVEVKVGRLPRGLNLPACERAEPFLPPNTRLWGRANVGLRCVEGGHWKTWIPVVVSAWGPGLVARRNLVPGEPVGADAVDVREVDWAATPRPPIAGVAELQGKELLRPVPAGRTLQADHLRETPTVRQGDAVPVTLSGAGFSIRVMATALASGVEGQRIGVRTPTGRILNGRIEGTGVVIPR